MKFRKKPVVIEAFKYLTDQVPDWWKLREGIAIEVETGDALIPTLEGVMRAKPGDFIIRGIMGDIYPCKADIFEATYEPVNPPADKSG